MNKLLNALLNISTEEVNETKKYIGNTVVTVYYVETIYEDSHHNRNTIRIESADKTNLAFSIDELYLYLILIMNAKSSNLKPYHMSMRKLRNVRNLSSDSEATYIRHMRALERLSKKEVSILPLKSIHKSKPIYSKMLVCNMPDVNNERIKEFDYTFDELSDTWVKTRQNVMIQFNPFAYSMKQVFMFQAMIYLIRMIVINKKYYNSRKISVQGILIGAHRFNANGFMLDENYYDYIVNAGNKQSEILKKCCLDFNEILSLMKKKRFIKRYDLPKNSTFKYIRDNEAFINIVFK
jgi:hypothetical protein